jgi:hypothetical protein
VLVDKILERCEVFPFESEDDAASSGCIAPVAISWSSGSKFSYGLN